MISLKHALAAVAACACNTAFAARPAVALPGPGNSYITPAASAELAAICPTGVGYPAAWTWYGQLHPTPSSATSGQPRIDQVRGGVVIATYTTFADQPTCTMVGDGTDHINPARAAATGCGPFTREHTFRLWNSGDVFNVYPAVYSGENNQPWFGPEADDGADEANGIVHSPDNVTVQGIVQNNVRPVILLTAPASNNTLGQAPVYFDVSNGMKIDSINVVGGPGTMVGKAGVYEAAASNLTLSNMRITGFAKVGANGLFGAGGYSGTLTLKAVELDHNGGSSGPSHNAYIGASMVDPAFTVNMSHSWTHNAVYGHLFKSRAQINVFTANYFQGTTPFNGSTQAEAYLLDVPNGGLLTARDNIFVKNASGPQSNGMSITFAMEGFSDNRPQAADIENNTFVTMAETYDGSHPNYPLSFFYPNVRPDSMSWPANIPTRIIKNAFVGYCPQGGGSPDDYRGDLALTESFGETSQIYAFSTKVTADDAVLALYYPNYVPIIGTPSYTQNLDALPVRMQMTLGAED